MDSSMEKRSLIERTAIFDPTGRYRYQLTRRWQTHGPTVTFVMLNPSRADATCDDPTLRACVQFAQRWDYAALSVVNLFGYCTAYPSQLKEAINPIGPENDAYVLRSVAAAQRVVLAWGNWGGLYGRDRTILNLLSPYRSKLHCIQLNRSGHPRHPLYIKRDLPLQPFTAPAISTAPQID
ncbi:MAG: DUF1643 domain-containing protein [Phormidesmis sp.]